MPKKKSCVELLASMMMQTIITRMIPAIQIVKGMPNYILSCILSSSG